MHLLRNFSVPACIIANQNKSLLSYLVVEKLFLHGCQGILSKCAWQEIKMPMRTSCATFFSLDIHYQRCWVRANTLNLVQDFYHNTFSSLNSMLKITFLFHRPPSRPTPWRFSQRIAFTFTRKISLECVLFVECVIWIFIRAHASQMNQNLIKKLFTSNHLNRKSEETFVIELVSALMPDPYQYLGWMMLGWCW